MQDELDLLVSFSVSSVLYVHPILMLLYIEAC